MAKNKDSRLDPVEAAKMGNDTSPEDVTEDVTDAGMTPPKEPVIEKPAAPSAPSKVFVVTNKGPTTISWGRQSITLRPGDEITEDSYGDGAIAKLQAAGVGLEEKKA